MSYFRKFPKIPRLKGLLYDLNKTHHGKELSFTPTIKMHGTNAGIYFDREGKPHPQGRNRSLTPTNDNFGFAEYALQRDSSDLQKVYVYGEWVGPGIQKGVALSQLPKKEFIPYCKFNEKFGYHWEDALPYCLAFNIPTVRFTVGGPMEEVVALIKQETLKVESQCPVGKHFGVEGIGEGIVWWCNELNGVMFKSKGDKHQSGKGTPYVPPTAEELAAIGAARTFAKALVTPERVEQALRYLDEMGFERSKKSTGHFMKYFQTDLEEESRAERVEAGFTWGQLQKTTSTIARDAFFKAIKD